MGVLLSAETTMQSELAVRRVMHSQTHHTVGCETWSSGDLKCICAVEM